jgi:hypothetical protein
MIENKKTIQIKDLLMNEPAPPEEVFSDPRKILGRREWDTMRNVVQEKINNRELYFSDMQMLSDISILDPGLVRPFVTNKVWKHMRKGLKREGAINIKPTYARYMHLTAPQRAKSEDLFSESETERIQSYINSNTIYFMILPVQTSLSILGDKYNSINSGITEENWDYMKRVITFSIESRHLDQKDVVPRMADLKIFAPQRFKEEIESDRVLMDLFWKQMKDEITINLKSQNTAFIEKAANMAIIAAEKVTVLENGLDLFFPEPKIPKISKTKMPERRRF